MKTILGERGQVVIPKKIRDSLGIEKGDELDVMILHDTITLKPIRRFRATRWQDYIAIGQGIVDMHLEETRIEKATEDVYP